MVKKKRANKSPNIKNLKSYWEDSLSYVYETRYYIYLAIMLFIFSGAVAFIFPNNFVFLNDIIRELLAKTQGKGAIDLTWFIFTNNISAAFVAIFAGLVLGIMPILNALTNGLVLGYVLALTYEAAGVLSFWRLLPHGIFELPAIFISIGLGIRFGTFIFTKQKKEEFFYRLYNSLKVFTLIVLPLLIIAAIIEGLLIAYLS